MLVRFIDRAGFLVYNYIVTWMTAQEDDMDNTFSNYSLTQYTVWSLLGMVSAKTIAIPDMQRPYVWSSSQVRDFIDSLYHGYPTGYLIISQNPDINLKNGEGAHGKQILIDGQQRITSLTTALLGWFVRTASYKKVTIKIAFNPIEERFEVQTAPIAKDKRWIADISTFFSNEMSQIKLFSDYMKNNTEADEEQVFEALSKLSSIKNRQLGAIVLSPTLESSEVTEVFVRINSQGKRLNEADFAMSKIAANEAYGGTNLRKAIDYFCHVAVEPSFFEEIKRDDSEFIETEYAKKMSWLAWDKSDIYDPDYTDMLRVAFMHKFGRAKLNDLVSLLSGRDFESKDYKEAIAEETFKNLSNGVLRFMDKYCFEQFTAAIHSAGFRSTKILNAQMPMNFAYTLFLTLYHGNEIQKQEIKHYVQRWYVFSRLTGRYSSSAESRMSSDLKTMREKGFVQMFNEAEATYLTSDFWNTQLVSQLEVASTGSPFFCIYLAAQVFFGDKSLLHSSVGVETLISSGDVHHIFPKAYLKTSGINDKRLQNQIANFTYLDTSVNVAISDAPPSEYLTANFELSRSGSAQAGTITSEAEFWNNLDCNCIPRTVLGMSAENYHEFLEQRRKLMAEKIRAYYYSL